MGRFPSTYVNAQGARKRLTAVDVEMIHAHRNTTTAELARQIGFSETTIHNVRVGNTWPELHPAYQAAAQAKSVPNQLTPQVESIQMQLAAEPVNIQNLIAQLGGETPQALTVPTPQVSYPPDVSKMQRLPGMTLGQEPGEDDMFYGAI